MRTASNALKQHGIIIAVISGEHSDDAKKTVKKGSKSVLTATIRDFRENGAQDSGLELLRDENRRFYHARFEKCCFKELILVRKLQKKTGDQKQYIHRHLID